MPLPTATNEPAGCSWAPASCCPPRTTHPPTTHPPPAPQSAFGRSSLAVSSLLSYVGLGLGLLGSSLALPFGLYVLICQRTAGGCCWHSVWQGVNE